MRILALGLWLTFVSFAQQSPQAVAKALFPKDDELARQRLDDVARLMGLQTSSTVADVGCGSGEVAVIWSRAVGPSGRVYAEDIDKDRLKQARKLVKKHRARNVTIVRGEVADPRLPAGQLDGISLFWVYHELEKYPEMLARLRTALKPDGRLVIIDPVPHKTATRAREIQSKNHVLKPDIAEGDLRKAGFDIVHRDDRFIDDPDSEGVAWVLVARPATTSPGP